MDPHDAYGEVGKISTRAPAVDRCPALPFSGGNTQRCQGIADEVNTSRRARERGCVREIQVQALKAFAQNWLPRDVGTTVFLVAGVDEQHSGTRKEPWWVQ